MLVTSRLNRFVLGQLAIISCALRIESRLTIRGPSKTTRSASGAKIPPMASVSRLLTAAAYWATRLRMPASSFGRACAADTAAVESSRQRVSTVERIRPPAVTFMNYGDAGEHGPGYHCALEHESRFGLCNERQHLLPILPAVSILDAGVDVHPSRPHRLDCVPHVGWGEPAGENDRFRR